MSGSPPTPPVAPGPLDGPLDGPLHWTVHPAAENPGRAALVLAIVGISALLAARVSGMPFFGWLALVVLLASVRAYFLPRTYELDAEGARESGPLCASQRLTWDKVRRVVPARFGVHLSPRLSTSRLLPDRGLFLRTAGNRQQVLEFVDRMAS